MDTARGAALFALAGPLWMAVRRVVATATATASHRPVDRGGGESEEAAAVLSYWFDGDTSQNYKYKWFPSSNRDIQEKADRDVTDRFSACLQLALNDGLGYWGDGARATIAKIIVLDQFSRHIYRHLPSDAPERKEADAKALVLAERLVRRSDWPGTVSTPEFVFSLMPFRHSSTLERLEAVMAFISERKGVSGKDQELLSKFQKQTLRRYQALQDRAKAAAAGDIVDHHYFAADERDIMTEPLVSAVLAFITNHLAVSSENVALAVSLSGGVDSMVIAKILAVLRDRGSIQVPGGAPIGGLRKTDRGRKNVSKQNPPAVAARPAANVTVVALHLDYGNRPESAEEARYVEYYAKEILKLDWRIREITEVTRGVTDRSDYEKISRNIRYSFYKEVLNELSCPGIIFGHHIGDVQENVISNVMRGSSSLHLSGMTDVGVTEGVSVWRPLLSNNKDEIYAFAHKYGVPYLQDTTPSWSTRGKLRNVLLPLLMDIYGTGCMHNLSSLAADSDAMRALVQETVFGPFLETIVRYDCGISIEITDSYREQSAVFWTEALKQIMHSMGMSLVREKAVQNFIGRIHILAKETKHSDKRADRRVSFKADTPKPLLRIMPGWVELRKGFNCYIDEKNTLCILRQGALRPSGSASRPANDKCSKKADTSTSTSACVEVRVNGDNTVSSMNVLSTGSSDMMFHVHASGTAFAGDNDNDTVLKVDASELASPLQKTLLDIRVCLSAMSALNLAYPLSPRRGESEGNQSREFSSQSKPVTFNVDFGVWRIRICLTPSAQQVGETPVPAAPARALSPDAMVFSDGELSDLDEDGIWHWSAGVSSSERAASPPAVAVSTPPLKDIYDLLRGQFCYDFSIYHHNCVPESASEGAVCANSDNNVASVIPLQLKAGMTAAGIRDLKINSLKGIDGKIREGLPLICPVNVLDESLLEEQGTDRRASASAVCTVSVCYTYILDNDK